MDNSIDFQDLKKSKSLSEIQQLQIRQKQKSQQTNKTIICIAITFLILILLYVVLIKTGIMKTFLQNLQNFLKTTYKESKTKVIVVIFLMMFFVIIFGLPAHMLLSIFSSLVIKEKLIAYFVLLGASVFGSLIVYLFCQWKCKEFLLKRFKNNNFYEILKIESQTKPFQTAFLARLLFIPAGMKDYILSLISNPFIPFMLSAILLHAFFCLESVLIAKEFTEIEEFMTNNKNWNQKSFFEKMSLILLIFFIVFTLLFATYLGCWVTKKFQEKREIEIDLETNIRDKTLMNEQLNQIINKMKVEDNQKKIDKKEEKKDKKDLKEEELSEQDKELKENIELMVNNLQDQNTQQKLTNLDQLFQLIIGSKKTRTQIPKEIKFLQPHYQKLKEIFDQSEQNQFKKNLADFLAYVCISLEENYDRNSLRYIEQGNGIQKIEKWGQEFAINLAGDIGKDYNERYAQGQTESFKDLYDLSDLLLPFMFKNGDTINAVDLLLDIERLDKLQQHVKEDNYRRIYDYLVSSVDYASDTIEFEAILDCTLKLSLTQNKFVDALRVAIRKNDKEKIQWIYNNVKDKATKIQLAFNLARNRIVIKENDQQLQEIISNQKLSPFYLQLVKDLNLVDPKRPREVYKEMLGEKSTKIDSSQLNLADTFTNAFVNFGTSKDTLFNNKDDDRPWIQRVQKKGIFSAVCSLGLIHMWNFEELSNIITDYFDLKDGYARAGACVAIGLSVSGIYDENDPACAFLNEAVESEDNIMKLGAAIGFGFAYSGSNREDLKDNISELIIDENLGVEVNANAAISLSHIFVGELDQDVINTILSALMVYSKDTLDQPFARMLAVALGINFIGQQNHCEATLEALQAIEHPVAQIAQIIIETCSYIGSGNVLIIQKYMQMAAKKYDVEKDQLEIEKVCVGLIAVSLIAVSETVGRKMVIRNIHHILQYSDLAVKRVVPILLAILGIHNFNIQVTDLLYKLAHNDDKEIAMRSIFALGLISAGTNNSRVGGLLKNLGIYYEEENDYCFVVRIALGLLHSGKGLLTLNQYFSEGLLYNKSGFAGLIVIFYAMLNFEEFLVKNNHYLLFHLSLALYPKMLFAIDEDLNNVPIYIRVGTAIDTVTQVGQPRKITGFQTHTSPVVVDNDERAELGTEEYITASSDIMENIVVVKKNPEFKEEERS